MCLGWRGACSGGEDPQSFGTGNGDLCNRGKAHFQVSFMRLQIADHVTRTKTV